MRACRLKEGFCLTSALATLWLDALVAACLDRVAVCLASGTCCCLSDSAPLPTPGLCARSSLQQAEEAYTSRNWRHHTPVWEGNIRSIFQSSSQTCAYIAKHCISVLIEQQIRSIAICSVMQGTWHVQAITDLIGGAGLRTVFASSLTKHLVMCPATCLCSGLTMAANRSDQKLVPSRF